MCRGDNVISNPAYEDGTVTVFRNVRIQQQTPRPYPKVHTRFKTRRYFEMKNAVMVLTG
jgi:hypothetical protein